MSLDARTTLAVTAILVAALALVGAPAAADDGDDVGIATGDGLNSTVDLNASAEEAGHGGAGEVDCEGQPTHHQCDKRGELHGDAGSVDYAGDTYSDDDDTRFGGGDEFVLAGGGEELLVGFYCTFDPSPSPETCDVDLGSSQGDAPGQFAPEDDGSADDGGPGSERSERGDENGRDDGNRSETSR